MKLPKGTVILNVDSPAFAADIAREIGDGPVELITPQFHRIDGVQVAAPNLTQDEWENLGNISPDRLLQFGCQIWDENADVTHWLFPGQWYQFIPDGLSVIGINKDIKVFRRGVTDDDIRFGALAYGFMTAKIRSLIK
jgi:hypothetical protein